MINFVTKKSKSLYRITFANQDATYEIYAYSIAESAVFGFLEVAEFAFGENSGLLVDPAEEQLKIEFANITRTFIPIQSIYRIDEVEKQGIAKIKENGKADNKVSLFPISHKRQD